MTPSSLYAFTAEDRFPLARDYRTRCPNPLSTLREPDPVLTDPFTERHLHCVWFDDRLRPTSLSTRRGETLRVLRPGNWNFEAGPDFLDAEWELGGRRIRGDVEIHIRPLDWRNHGHHHDPRYRNVRLHITHEPGALDPGLLPPDCEEVSLRDALEARSHFFFDTIDTSAYPWDVDRGLSGLRQICEDLDDHQRAALLDAAGQERLRRKTLRMARAVRAVGPEQALYQAVTRALGYKHNANPCEELARRIPVHELRRESDGRPDLATALLLGVAGLLPHDLDLANLPPWENPQSLWQTWWRLRESYTGRLMSPEDWRLDGGRPGNHPRIRLRAAAEIFTPSPTLEEHIQPRPNESPRQWLRRCRQRLQVRQPGPGENRRRLVGPQRAAAILVNALLPWRAVTVPEEIPLDLLRALPAEPGNATTRRAAHALFGPDHHPRLWRDTLRKQGLLQFHEDFGI